MDKGISLYLKDLAALAWRIFLLMLFDAIGASIRDQIFVPNTIVYPSSSVELS